MVDGDSRLPDRHNLFVGVAEQVAVDSAAAIVAHPQIAMLLTEWTGDRVAVPGDPDALGTKRWREQSPLSGKA